MGKIISIDLGTGNSCMAIMEGGKPTVIPNAEGQFTTPSIVGFSKTGEILVGLPAKRQATVNAERTVISIKRFMGRSWDEVQDEVKHVSYPVVNVNGKPRVRIDGKDYSPEQISSMILAKLKRDAESYLGETITDAIITCPAYFDSTAKEATKNAGTIAGLNVLRVISEPTSACLSYGLDKKKNGVIAVVDEGCGTSDLSIIDISDGLFEVKSTNGDNHLGGWDVDNAIAKWIVEEFKVQNGIDLSKDNMAMQRIVDESEKAKIELSTTQQYEINLPFITADSTGPKHIQMTLTRAKFESIIEPLFERLREPIRQCMKDAGVDKIDEVILVGGTTRIPYVQKKIKEFYGIEPSKNANPDFVVAEGGAIQGSILTGETKDVLLLDITPLDICIETLGGIATPIVEKNTTIPTKKSQVFSTASDNQPAITVRICQGNRKMFADNKLIGQFNLDGILPAPRGVPQEEITVDIDSNNIITVTAKDLGTGKDAHITIAASSGMTKEEIEKAKADAEKFAEEDKRKSELITAKNNAESLCFQIEKQMKDNHDKINDEGLESEINAKIADVREAIKTDDKDKIDSSVKSLTEAAQKIGEKIYGNNGSTPNFSPEDLEKMKNDPKFASMFGAGGPFAGTNGFTTSDNESKTDEPINGGTV